MSRRRFLRGGVLVGAGLALYAGEVERHWIELNEVEVRLRGLAEAFDGMRVAQVSDIHMDAYTEPFFLRYAVERIDALKPDVVLLTGDFVSDRPGTQSFMVGAAWQCANLLNGLECKQRYAVMGNHDHFIGATQVTEALMANGITVLTNRAVPLERERARLWLAGVDDPLTGKPDAMLAIPPAIRSVAREPVVLMCHGPDYVDHLISHGMAESIALVLSGHTHGGQVRLPFYGPLTLPEMGQKYVEGMFRFGEMQLYVNRGIGTVGVPFRFDCPPEITLFTLRRLS